MLNVPDSQEVVMPFKYSFKEAVSGYIPEDENARLKVLGDAFDKLYPQAVEEQHRNLTPNILVPILPSDIEAVLINRPKDTERKVIHLLTAEEAAVIFSADADDIRALPQGKELEKRGGGESGTTISDFIKARDQFVAIGDQSREPGMTTARLYVNELAILEAMHVFKNFGYNTNEDIEHLAYLAAVDSSRSDKPEQQFIRLTTLIQRLTEKASLAPDISPK